MEQKQGSSISFFQKNKTICPVCGAGFSREEVRTGRGRLIAGSLTKELRRNYEPSKKFGEVFPLIYPVIVCPDCYYAAFSKDFNAVSEKEIGQLNEQREKRAASIGKIFGDINFREFRTVKEGVASYYFMIMCGDFLSHRSSPALKQGIASLRAAWLFTDLHRKFPGDNYDYLSGIFYRKARFFYTLTLEYEGSGTESITEVDSPGPDLDKNYGYDGVLYLSAYLEHKYGPVGDDEKRQKSLQFAKRTVAKIFGMGKASKNKPSALLEMSKDLHVQIGNELKTGDDSEDDQP